MADRGDEQRFRDLYRRHHPALTAFLARRIGRQDAADAVDDVFTVAWRRMDAIPDGDGSLLWLYGVARNVVANRRRATRRHNRLLARVWGTRPSGLSGPEPEVMRDLEGRQAVDALSRLRASDRELLVMAYWDGLTHTQIADLLGCSKSAIDSRVHRALVRLRKALPPSGHERRVRYAAGDPGEEGP
jgi:RNA polymerase sigma-70 factor (ECF subfamily)